MNETRAAGERGAERDNIHENGARTFFAFAGRSFQTENSNGNNLPAFNFAVSFSPVFVDCCEKRFTVTLLLFISGERQSMRAHFCRHFFSRVFNLRFALSPSRFLFLSSAKPAQMFIPLFDANCVNSAPDASSNS